MNNRLITCINCGLEGDTTHIDNYLEICLTCQVNMGIREEEIKS